MRIKSMRGVEVDMAAIIAQNETVVAVGNARMNARGDIIGRRGEIVKSRDEIAQEYHRSNPKAVRNVALKDLADETIGSDKMGVNYVDPAKAMAALDEQAKAAKTAAKAARKIEDTDD